jgi:DNA-binding MarR family transcriptional regulator
MLTTQMIRDMNRVIKIFQKCGALTEPQLRQVMHLYSSNRVTRWMILNDYVGVMPTIPPKLTHRGRVLDMPEMPVLMAEILATMKQLGPCTSKDIADALKIGRETIDSNLRRMRSLDLCHTCGDTASTIKARMRVYLWAAGEGKNFVRVKSRAKPKKVAEVAVVKPKARLGAVRRDALTEALFGRAA